MSAVIAAEAMRRLPRMRSYGAYPRNTRFGDFRVSHDGDLARAGRARRVPVRRLDPAPRLRTRRLCAGSPGYGSSPIVTYEGEGIYFLDRVRPGVWRLEVYPDAVPVRDPFEPPSPDKVVTRAIRRAWPMTRQHCRIWASRSRSSRSPAGNPQPDQGRCAAVSR